MKTIIKDLKELEDHIRHYEFELNDVFYDIWFSFDRRYNREQGGDRGEWLWTKWRDQIEIHKVVCLTSEGEEMEPDWQTACEIERLYNLK